MTTNCENCKGDGLVGAGEQPWLRQGRLERCTKCGGTGKVEDGAQDTAQVETPAGENRTTDGAEDIADSDGSKETVADGVGHATMSVDSDSARKVILG